MTASTTGELTVREVTDADLPAVLELLQASLGWVPDEHYTRFFAWKHHQNPFGRSPAWVAVDPAAGDRVVGFRTFLRWQFTRGGAVVDAVRAVDTATHPDYQGRGIFSMLTRHALEALRDTGTAFVFNTPNDQSRPGYLKMGWKLVAKLPVAATPRSPVSLLRVARARTPADKWSTPTDAGVPAAQALADQHVVATLLAEQPADDRLRTGRTPAYLAWRYGFPALRYRAITAPGGIAEGVVLFRLRRRGPATEAAICESLVPGGAGARPAQVQSLVRAVLRETGADHAVQIGAARPSRGLLPVPGQGPTLVWRGVNDTTMPLPDEWVLVLSDIELF